MIAGTKKVNEDERRLYFARKRKLYEFEKTNNSKIVFIRGTKGFWITGGHSAVIFANKIAKELNLRVNLKNDSDFDLKFKEGLFAVKNVEFYREVLKRSIYLEPGEFKEDSFSFKLKEPVSEAELGVLLETKEIIRKKLKAEIEKMLPLPKASVTLKDILRLTYSLYRKTPEPRAREIILTDYVKVIQKADFYMRLITRENLELEAGVKKIKSNLEVALCMLLQILDLEIWNPEKVGVLSTLIVEANLAMDLELKREKSNYANESPEIKSIKKVLEKNG